MYQMVIFAEEKSTELEVKLIDREADKFKNHRLLILYLNRVNFRPPDGFTVMILRCRIVCFNHTFALNVLRNHALYVLKYPQTYE